MERGRHALPQSRNDSEIEQPTSWSGEALPDRQVVRHLPYPIFPT
jgi:hypothetical protein